MYRKKGYIIARIAGLLAVLLMAFLVALQMPFVQTRLSKVALNQLAAIMDGRVQYDELKVLTSGVLVIRNLALVDPNPYTEDVNGRGWAPADTVFKAKTITATFSLTGLFKKEGLHLGRVTIEDGSFHLVTEPGEEYHDNISRIFHLKPTGAPPPTANLFNIKKLRIQNFRFRMNSFLPDRGLHKGVGINFEDLDLTADIVGHGFRMADAKITGYFDRLSAQEKSGYTIDQFSSSVELGLENGALLEDLHLRDPWSDVHMRSLELGYQDFKYFSDFVNKVRLDGEFQRSSLALQSLTYFSGAFNGSPLVAEIRRGHVSGPVCDLLIDRLVFTESSTGVSTTVDGRITGLPDIQTTLLDATLKDLQCTTTQMSHFLGGLAPESPEPDLSMLAHNVPLTLQVKAKGPFNDLDIDILVQSVEGEFTVTGDLRHVVDPTRPIDMALNLVTRELDLGKVLGVDVLGPANVRTRFRAQLNGGIPDTTIDSLYIDHIRALGHDLHNISVAGSLSDDVAQGHIVSADPLLRLDLTGFADIKPNNGRSRYQVDGTIAEANLAALGFDAGGKLSRVATGIHADLVRSSDNRFQGNAHLDNLRLMDDQGTHPLGNIRVNARTDGEWQEIDLGASFLDARFHGDRPVTSFVRDLQEITLRRELPTLYTDEYEPQGTGNYEVNAIFHDTRDILALFVPGAYIADGTGLSLSVTDNGLLKGELNSERIAFDKNYLRNVDLLFDNRHNELSANIVSSELRAGNLAMLNPAINAGANDDRLSLGVHYDNFSGTGGDATINLEGRLFRDEEDGTLGVLAHPIGSYIVAGDDTWSFAESDIILHGKDVRLDNFLIHNGAQRLLVDGGFSSAHSDTLALQMDRFDLALVDQFLTESLGIEGKMNGTATVTSGPDKAIGMLMDFRLDTLRLSGVDAGTMLLSSQWQREGKELGISLRDIIEERDALKVGGSYFPQEKRLNLRADLDRFPIAVATAFLPDVISEVGGGITGSLNVTGSPDNLIPYSQDLHIDDAFVHVAVTGVPYTVEGPIRVDENGCYLDGVAIRDNDNGLMTVNAALRYKQLKDFILDGRIDFNNLKILDTPAPRADVPFYGYLRASGTASARGALTALSVDADVSTSGEGDVHITTGATSAQTGNSRLLTFTQPVLELDPYEELLASLHKKTTQAADIVVHGRVHLQPAVRAFVEIDKEAGNVASVNGQGTVSINLRPSRALFELNGDYNISEGTYQFVLPGVLSKNFSVQRGSSVKFGGDIMNTELDITANYGLRTSLDPILGTGNLSRRQVNCVLNVSDRLRAPKLNLSIDVPDLDPSTQMAVESALSTNDKVQKQFVSLLLLGSFLPDASSGVFTQSNLLYSNVMEMMSGQINNVLQRLEIPIDVGFGYQEMRSGENLFDISLSTELFDNRVHLGGSFGNRRYSTGSAGGDFTGNLDLQVKLDPEGKFRFNVFSHSADEFTNYLDFSQRNGVGVSFQKEYASFDDFWRSIFVSRKRREILERLDAEKLKEQVIIQIDHEPGETLPDPDTAR